MNGNYKGAALALMGVGALVCTASPAAARVVCNADGDCWHAQTDYAYEPTLGLAIHPDEWNWGKETRYHWKEHEGNGYWHKGEWKGF